MTSTSSATLAVGSAPCSWRRRAACGYENSRIVARAEDIAYVCAANPTTLLSIIKRMRELEDKCIEMSKYIDERRVEIERFRTGLLEALEMAHTNPQHAPQYRLDELRALAKGE